MKNIKYLILCFGFGVILSGCMSKSEIRINDTNQVTKSSTETSTTVPEPTAVPVTATPSAVIQKINIENDYFALVSLLDWVSNDELYSRIPDKKTADMDYFYIDLRNNKNTILPRYAPGVSPEDMALFIDHFDGETEQVYVSPDGNQFVIFVNIPGSRVGICACHNYDLWKYDKPTGEYTLLSNRNGEFQQDHIILMLDPSSLLINDKENHVFMFHSGYPYHEYVDLQTGDYFRYEANTRCMPFDRPVFSGNGEVVLVQYGLFWKNDYFNFLKQCDTLLGNTEKDDDLIKILYQDFERKYKFAEIPESVIENHQFFEMNDAGNHYYFNDIDSGDSENTYIGNIVRMDIQTSETYIVVPEAVIRNNGLDVAELSVRVSPDEDRILLIPERYGKDVFIYSFNE